MGIMVSGIVPGAAGAGALNVEARHARGAPSQTQLRQGPAAGDRVELSATSFAIARESVRQGLTQVRQTLDLARQAMGLLLTAQSAAKGQASQADLEAALGAFAERMEAALAAGARLPTGEEISVQAEPDAAPVSIRGIDLRLKEAPLAEDVLISSRLRADDPALEQAAQRGLDKLQQAILALAESLRALEAHQGFLGAIESAAGVRRDLDTDGARLLALQVRQGLESARAPIANVDPQAVLSLFRG